MYRNTPPSNPYGQGVPQSGFDSSGYRSQMPRPRFQSSPRYHPQHGSPNPYFCGAGRGEFSSRGGHRSPRSFPSPRHEFVSPEQYGYDSPNSTFSPYLDRSMNQGQNNGNRNNSRGRGRYSSPGTRDFSSARGSSDCDSNPGGNNDIRQYYNPKMVQDPWAGLQAISMMPKAEQS